MLKPFFGIVVMSYFLSCVSKEKKEQVVEEEALEQQVNVQESKLSNMTLEDLTVYNFEGLEPMLHREDGTLYVINFWATWCAPCVKELPYFEQINTELKDENVEIILVSLDMPKMWETHLIHFLQKKELKSEVVVLDDTKQNEWIPKVAANWEGAIPATLIYKGGNRKFYETPFTYESLREEIDTFLN